MKLKTAILLVLSCYAFANAAHDVGVIEYIKVGQYDQNVVLVKLVGNSRELKVASSFVGGDLNFKSIAAILLTAKSQGLTVTIESAGNNTDVIWVAL